MILIREEDLTQAERRKKRQLTVYIAIACLFVVAALLLLFLSPDRYQPYMAATIVLSVAFGCYSVFFFSVVYDEIVKRCRLLAKVLSALPEREYAVFVKETDVLTYEGLEMRTFRFLVRGDERDVHLYSGDISLSEGKEYVLEIRAGVMYEIGGRDEKEVL